MIKHSKSGHPYLTQEGKDREQGSDQYIANMCDGAVAGFKYFDLRETSKVRINIKGKQLELFMYPQRKAASQWQRFR